MDAAEKIHIVYRLLKLNYYTGYLANRLLFSCNIGHCTYNDQREIQKGKRSLTANIQIIAILHCSKIMQYEYHAHVFMAHLR